MNARKHLTSRGSARSMASGLLIALIGIVMATEAHADDEVTVTPLAGKIQVDFNGNLFTEYVYGEHAKPILYPIVGPHGIGMTRNYPMKSQIEGEASDHPHQKSMWFTHGDVNGVDFWGEGPGRGRIVQDRIVRTMNGSRWAGFETTNRWLGPKDELICTDTRQLTFWAIPQGRVIDWQIDIHASNGDVVFGDTKEGTMGIRTHPNLRLHNDPDRGVTTASGQARNSEGVRGLDVWGKRAAWVDYWAKIDGNTVGVAILDHPANPRHPTWWHARDYGLIAANPFGVHNFTGKPAGSGDMKIPAGQQLTLRYRFLFHEGDANQADISQQYRRYAEVPPGRVLPIRRLPRDRRLQAVKDLDGYFPFSPPRTVEEWQQRAAKVVRRIQVATGLWPEPARQEPVAVVHGRVDRDDYTVEKVYLESYPGHFVTGNLYRPKGRDGPRPVVLSPHGHFAGGRFHDHGLQQVRQEIINGAERFEVGGRHPLQSRCVQLARMGCIVFLYDMVGFGDSQQISYDLAHRHINPRPEFDTRENWGFFSTQAELRLQSVMGLQTYNSICALDWITRLPDVDPQRIGVTGASGGGTQTMILCAVDPRPTVSFPAVMVSTAMQGGCTCENACCLRVATGNIEFAGLFAPKPLGMTAADDWTKEIATKGLPQLKQLYDKHGAQELVMARSLTHFPHNYNYVSRAVMYDWMNTHLDLGCDEPVVEEDFVPLTEEEMSVWNDEHPRPAGGAENERALLRTMNKMAEEQIAGLMPHDHDSLVHYQEVVGSALATLIGRELPPAGTFERTRIDRKDHGDYFEFHDLLQYTAFGEELPTVFLLPKTWSGDVVIWVEGEGKQAIFDRDGVPRPEIQELLRHGMAVTSADLLYQGEFLADGESLTQTRKVKNPRDFAGFTYGYNPTLFAQRVHDILSLVSFVRNDEHAPQRVHLVGLRGAGPWVAAARGLAGSQVDLTAVDTDGFRFAELTSWRDENFLPGAVKYGDLPGLLALSAPYKMWIAGEGSELPRIVTMAYRASGQPHHIITSKSPPDKVTKNAVTWLTENRRL